MKPILDAPRHRQTARNGAGRSFTEPRRNDSGQIFALAIAAVFIVIGAGLLLYGAGVGNRRAVKNITPSPAPIPAPIPVPSTTPTTPATAVAAVTAATPAVTAN